MNNLNPRKLDGLPEGVQIRVTIDIHANGAMSVAGPIHDKEWMLALLDNAKDAVRNHHMPKSQQGIVIPDRDVAVPGLTEKAVA